MLLTAIDFEASCLPRHGRSFPIEVGIADERGVCSWLIRPDPAWQSWTWAPQAERLHGIARSRLEEEGLPAAQVAVELVVAVRGRRLVADSHLDAHWRDVLAAAAGQGALPPIEHVGETMARIGARDAEIADAVAVLEAQPFRRHRAGDDARWLHGLIGQLQAAAQARAARPLFGWADGAARPAAATGSAAMPT